MNHADLSALPRATPHLYLPLRDAGQGGVLLCQSLVSAMPLNAQIVVTEDLIKLTGTRTSLRLCLGMTYPKHLNGIVRNHAPPKMTLSWGNLLAGCTRFDLHRHVRLSTKRRRHS